MWWFASFYIVVKWKLWGFEESVFGWRHLQLWENWNLTFYGTEPFIYYLRTFNIGAKFCGKPSISPFRRFTQYNKCQTHGGARGEVKGIARTFIITMTVITIIFVHRTIFRNQDASNAAIKTDIKDNAKEIKKCFLIKSMVLRRKQPDFLRQIVPEFWLPDSKRSLLFSFQPGFWNR